MLFSEINKYSQQFNSLLLSSMQKNPRLSILSVSSFIILFIARERKSEGGWGKEEGGGGGNQAVEGKGYGDLPHPLPLLKRTESYAVTQNPITLSVTLEITKHLPLQGSPVIFCFENPNLSLFLLCDRTILDVTRTF